MTPKERFELKRKIRLGTEKVTKREVLDLVEDNEALSKDFIVAKALLNEAAGALQASDQYEAQPSLSAKIKNFLDGVTGS